MDDTRKIVLKLSGAERSALFRLAEANLRDPRDQIRLIVRNELQQLGYLQPVKKEKNSDQATH